MQKYQSKYRTLAKQVLKIFLFAVTLISYKQGFCQEIQNLHLFGGPSNDELTTLITKDCHLIIGGSYGEGMNFAGQTLKDHGNADIFWGEIDGENETLISSGGSFENDRLQAIIRNSQSDLFVAGSFINEANFQDSILSAGANISAAFLSKYIGTELAWSIILNGDSYEQVNDMAVDENDNIYVAGYYKSSLTINQMTISTTANEAAFIFKITSEGELLWLRSFGIEGNNRIKEISYCEQTGQIILAGDFKGVLKIGDAVIQANTFDEDLFIASIDKEGTPQWLIKAGGVYIDDLKDMVTSEAGDIYLTGNFRGIINIDDQLQIETQGSLDDNLFLIKLDNLGNPIWARSLGEQEFSETGFAICLSEDENELYLTGYTTGNMQIDAVNFVPTDDADFHIFITSFSTSAAELNWIIGPEAATGLIVPNLMTLTECGDLFIGGAIRGSIEIQGERYESEAYDGFITKVNLAPNAIFSPSTIQEIKAFPNPTKGCFQLKNEEAVTFSLFDLSGGFLLEKALDPREEICLEGLTGLFFWKAQTKTGSFAFGRIVLAK